MFARRASVLTLDLLSLGRCQFWPYIFSIWGAIPVLTRFGLRFGELNGLTSDFVKNYAKSNGRCALNGDAGRLRELRNAVRTDDLTTTIFARLDFQLARNYSQQISNV